MFLSISYSHYELRLGIVSGTELPMMLWFIDVLLMQFSEMEKRYIKGKNGGYEWYEVPVVEGKGKAKKGKTKGKTAEHVLEGTHVLSDYWTFFINYERGLLFVGMHQKDHS